MPAARYVISLLRLEIPKAKNAMKTSSTGVCKLCGGRVASGDAAGRLPEEARPVVLTVSVTVSEVAPSVVIEAGATLQVEWRMELAQVNEIIWVRPSTGAMVS